MRLVHIFVAKRPSGNPITVNTVYKAFGENIPRYLALEGGNYKGPDYLFCVDRNIDIEGICNKYNYKCEPERFKKYEVDDAKYNNQYQIIPTYFSDDIPYRLDKYKPSGYPDSDSE